MIKLIFSTPHKSIQNFTPVSLPPLSVIYGVNGCGKSQLLEAIANNHIFCTDEAHKPFDVKKIYTSTPTLITSASSRRALDDMRSAAEDTLFLLDNFEAALQFYAHGTQIYITKKGNAPFTRQNLLTALIQNNKLNKLAFSGPHTEKLESIVFEKTGGKGLRNRLEGFYKFVPLSFLKKFSYFDGPEIKKSLSSFITHQPFMAIDVSAIFYRYYEQETDNAYSKATGAPHLTDAEFRAQYGSPPWDEINNLMEKYGFTQQFIPPDKKTDPKAIRGYTARLRCDNGNIIDADALSSGEKVILALLLSALAIKQQSDAMFQLDNPDIILFDELDAHLHPSMTKMMFSVLQDSLVEQLKCPVIITTHSPSTVALAPEKTLFNLIREQDSHRLISTEKALAGAELCEGLFHIMDGSKIVIVEGKEDPIFYQSIEKVLRSERMINDVPLLRFIPASHSKDPSNGGGSDSARNWAQKLSDVNLPNVFALLDKDNGRKDEGVVLVNEERYAIENFILDPISLAITLIVDQKLNLIDNDLANEFIKVSDLEKASTDRIQTLVLAISSYIIKNKPKNVAKIGLNPTIEVSYCDGKLVQIPEWFLTMRGKSLRDLIRESFKPYVITKDDKAYPMTLGYLLKHLLQFPGFLPTSFIRTFRKFI